MTLDTKPYDPALLIKTNEDIATYLSDAFTDDDPNVFIIALGDVARIKGISELAKETGLNRESLYKAFSGKSQPKWSTIHKLLTALGVKLNVAA